MKFTHLNSDVDHSPEAFPLLQHEISEDRESELYNSMMSLLNRTSADLINIQKYMTIVFQQFY